MIKPINKSLINSSMTTKTYFIRLKPFVKVKINPKNSNRTKSKTKLKNKKSTAN